MTRIHQVPDINYFAFIDIEDKQAGLQSIEAQFGIFSYMVKSKKAVKEMSQLSSDQLNGLIDRIYNLQLDIRNGKLD